MNRIIIGLAAVLLVTNAFASNNNNSNNSGDANATATASHNGNTTATGGNANVQNYNDVRNTNINSNVNSNKNEQSQGQGQVQGQGQGQRQSTKNSNNAAQSVTVNTPKQAVPAASVGTYSTASCMVGGGVSFGSTVGGAAIAGAIRDDICTDIEVAKAAMHYGSDADRVKAQALLGELLEERLAKRAQAAAIKQPTEAFVGQSPFVSYSN